MGDNTSAETDHNGNAFVKAADLISMEKTEVVEAIDPRVTNEEKYAMSVRSHRDNKKVTSFNESSIPRNADFSQFKIPAVRSTQMEGGDFQKLYRFRFIGPAGPSHRNRSTENSNTDPYGTMKSLLMKDNHSSQASYSSLLSTDKSANTPASSHEKTVTNVVSSAAISRKTSSCGSATTVTTTGTTVTQTTLSSAPQRHQPTLPSCTVKSIVPEEPQYKNAVVSSVTASSVPTAGPTESRPPIHIDTEPVSPPTQIIVTQPPVLQRKQGIMPQNQFTGVPPGYTQLTMTPNGSHSVQAIEYQRRMQAGHILNSSHMSKIDYGLTKVQQTPVSSASSYSSPLSTFAKFPRKGKNIASPNKVSEIIPAQNTNMTTFSEKTCVSHSKDTAAPPLVRISDKTSSTSSGPKQSLSEPSSGPYQVEHPPARQARQAQRHLVSPQEPRPTFDGKIHQHHTPVSSYGPMASRKTWIDNHNSHIIRGSTSQQYMVNFQPNFLPPKKHNTDERKQFAKSHHSRQFQIPADKPVHPNSQVSLNKPHIQGTPTHMYNTSEVSAKEYIAPVSSKLTHQTLSQRGPPNEWPPNAWPQSDSSSVHRSHIEKMSNPDNVQLFHKHSQIDGNHRNVRFDTVRTENKKQRMRTWPSIPSVVTEHNEKLEGQFRDIPTVAIEKQSVATHSNQNQVGQGVLQKTEKENSITDEKASPLDILSSIALQCKHLEETKSSSHSSGTQTTSSTTTSQSPIQFRNPTSFPYAGPPNRFVTPNAHLDPHQAAYRGKAPYPQPSPYRIQNERPPCPVHSPIQTYASSMQTRKAPTGYQTNHQTTQFPAAHPSVTNPSSSNNTTQQYQNSYESPKIKQQVSNTVNEEYNPQQHAKINPYPYSHGIPTSQPSLPPFSSLMPSSVHPSMNPAWTASHSHMSLPSHVSSDNLYKYSGTNVSTPNERSVAITKTTSINAAQACHNNHTITENMSSDTLESQTKVDNQMLTGQQPTTSGAIKPFTNPCTVPNSEHMIQSWNGGNPCNSSMGSMKLPYIALPPDIFAQIAYQQFTGALKSSLSTLPVYTSPGLTPKPKSDIQGQDYQKVMTQKSLTNVSEKTPMKSQVQAQKTDAINATQLKEPKELERTSTTKSNTMFDDIRREHTYKETSKWISKDGITNVRKKQKRGDYQCTLCHFSVRFNLKWKRHVKEQHWEHAESYFCKECLLPFTNKNDFMSHVKKGHPKMLPFNLLPDKLLIPLFTKFQMCKPLMNKGSSLSPASSPSVSVTSDSSSRDLAELNEKITQKETRNHQTAANAAKIAEAMVQSLCFEEPKEASNHTGVSLISHTTDSYDMDNTLGRGDTNIVTETMPVSDNDEQCIDPIEHMDNSASTEIDILKLAAETAEVYSDNNDDASTRSYIDSPTQILSEPGTPIETIVSTSNSNQVTSEPLPMPTISNKSNILEIHNELDQTIDDRNINEQPDVSPTNTSPEAAPLQDIDVQLLPAHKNDSNTEGITNENDESTDIDRTINGSSERSTDDQMHEKELQGNSERVSNEAAPAPENQVIIADEQSGCLNYITGEFMTNRDNETDTGDSGIKDEAASILIEHSTDMQVDGELLSNQNTQNPIESPISPKTYSSPVRSDLDIDECHLSNENKQEACDDNSDFQCPEQSNQDTISESLSDSAVLLPTKHILSQSTEDSNTSITADTSVEEQFLTPEKSVQHSIDKESLMEKKLGNLLTGEGTPIAISSHELNITECSEPRQIVHDKPCFESEPASRNIPSEYKDHESDHTETSEVIVSVSEVIVSSQSIDEKPSNVGNPISSDTEETEPPAMCDPVKLATIAKTGIIEIENPIPKLVIQIKPSSATSSNNKKKRRHKKKERKRMAKKSVTQWYGPIQKPARRKIKKYMNLSPDLFIKDTDENFLPDLIDKNCSSSDSIENKNFADQESKPCDFTENEHVTIDKQAHCVKGVENALKEHVTIDNQNPCVEGVELAIKEHVTIGKKKHCVKSVELEHAPTSKIRDIYSFTDDEDNNKILENRKVSNQPQGTHNKELFVKLERVPAIDNLGRGRFRVTPAGDTQEPTAVSNLQAASIPSNDCCSTLGPITPSSIRSSVEYEHTDENTEVKSDSVSEPETISSVDDITDRKDIESWGCLMCTFSSCGKDTVKQHITDSHVATKAFFCPKCSENSFDYGALEQHILNVHKDITVVVLSRRCPRTAELIGSLCLALPCETKWRNAKDKLQKLSRVGLFIKTEVDLTDRHRYVCLVCCKSMKGEILIRRHAAIHWKDEVEKCLKQNDDISVDNIHLKKLYVDKKTFSIAPTLPKSIKQLILMDLALPAGATINKNMNVSMESSDLYDTSTIQTHVDSTENLKQDNLSETESNSGYDENKTLSIKRKYPSLWDSSNSTIKKLKIKLKEVNTSSLKLQYAPRENPIEYKPVIMSLGPYSPTRCRSPSSIPLNTSSDSPSQDTPFLDQLPNEADSMTKDVVEDQMVPEPNYTISAGDTFTITESLDKTFPEVSLSLSKQSPELQPGPTDLPLSPAMSCTSCHSSQTLPYHSDILKSKFLMSRETIYADCAKSYVGTDIKLSLLKPVVLLKDVVKPL